MGTSPQGFAGDLGGNTQPIKPWAPADAVYCRTSLRHCGCRLLSLQRFPSSLQRLKPNVGASDALLRGQRANVPSASCSNANHRRLPLCCQLASSEVWQTPGVVRDFIGRFLPENPEK